MSHESFGVVQSQRSYIQNVKMYKGLLTFNKAPSSQHLLLPYQTEGDGLKYTEKVVFKSNDTNE